MKSGVLLLGLNENLQPHRVNEFETPVLKGLLTLNLFVFVCLFACLYVFRFCQLLGCGSFAFFSVNNYYSVQDLASEFEFITDKVYKFAK